MDIILIRHGETDFNRLKIFPTDEAGLNEKAKEELFSLKKRINNEFDLSTYEIFSSPMTRCRETCKCLDFDIESIFFDNRLSEFDYGVLKGKKHDENSYISGILEEWYKDINGYVLPGGENREKFLYRIKDFFNHISLRGKNSVLISHSGVIQSIICYALGLENYEYRFLVDTGSISILRKNWDTWSLYRLNYKEYIWFLKMSLWL